MSYGLDNYVNNKMSSPVLLFFWQFYSYILRKGRIRLPIVYISALDNIDMDVKKQSAYF